jgi:hypothetical protein
LIPVNTMSRYQVVAIFKDGREALLALGVSEAEARHFAKLHEPEIDLRGTSCFAARRWVELLEGGYWKTVATWAPNPLAKYVKKGT